MGIRPSEYMGILDEWSAYCFDRAIFSFGTALQNELDSQKVEGKDKDGKKLQAKRQRLLDKWIPDLNGNKPKFRDPGKR